MSDATLTPGDNPVRAYAVDAGNNIRSRLAAATFTIAATAKGTTVDVGSDTQPDYKPQFYAIVIVAMAGKIPAETADH